MKAKYVKELYNKYISDTLIGFIVQGHLLYHKNVEYLLRGFWFESSAFSAHNFNIYNFVQPLYIPSDDLWFNFSYRLGEFSEKGADKWWNISVDNEPEVMQEVVDLMKGPGLNFLMKLQSPQDLIRKYRINYSFR